MNPISPSFYYPTPPPATSAVSNENLFTDPKLLELLRKDLSEIQSRRTLERQNTYRSELAEKTQQSSYNTTAFLSPIQAFEYSSGRPLEANQAARSSFTTHHLPHHQAQPSSYPKIEMVKEIYEDGRIYEGPVV